MERRIKLNQRRYFHFEIEIKNEYKHIEFEYRKKNNEIRLHLNLDNLTASLRYAVGLNLICNKIIRIKNSNNKIKFMLPMEKTIANQNLVDYQLKNVLFYNKQYKQILKLEY